MASGGPCPRSDLMQCSLLVGSPFTFIFIKYFFILFLIHLFFSLHLPFLNNLRIQFNLISSLWDSSHLGAAQDTVTGRRWHLPGGAAGSPSRTLIYRAVGSPGSCSSRRLQESGGGWRRGPHGCHSRQAPGLCFQKQSLS